LAALGGREARSGGLSVTRIGELIGREKSQVSRTLRILAEHGLVERDPETLAYRLGWGVFALAAEVGEQLLLERAPDFLERLVDELGERAHLSVLQADQVLTVSSESPPRAVQAAGWVGRTVPVYCTSAGRALLFDHDRDRLDSLLSATEFRPLAPNTPRDLDELYARLEAARARGFAVADEEFERGLVAVGAPVRDFRGRIAAALNVSAPKFRFGRRLAAAGAAVRAAADDLSSTLGWRADLVRSAGAADSPR
jgi:DNA-binding IclR family transcriptional regulator